ncbi:MAG: hypothetical protein ACJA1A_002755 [Saprospiraceae bacterium]|jgi:hypothetical protein|tara:strand:+ start:248 stop:604 length:357 start_codon:yes stop_codon:yes gene_type:complete
MLKQNYLDKAIDWISTKSTITVKAQIDGYDPPKVFTNKQTGEEIQADFSFTTQGGSKSFTEVALKSDHPQKLVTRWKLLSLMASMKKGKLHLLTPSGHKLFTKKLVDTYHIDAVIHSL